MTTSTERAIGVVLLITSIVLSAAGQLGMKAGMQALGRFGGGGETALTLGTDAALQSALMWTAGGLLAYAVSLLTWLAVLVRYPLSYAYPLLSMSYVLVYLGATQWTRLMETATPLRTAGTLLILVGVCLVSLTENRNAH